MDSYAGEALPTDPSAYPIAPRLLLDLGDELLDSTATLNSYGSFMQPLTFEGGSHRFEHMSEALDNIATYLQQHLT